MRDGTEGELFELPYNDDGGQTKVCKDCGKELPISRFNVSTRSKTGHVRYAHYCKTCTAKSAKVVRQAKRNSYARRNVKQDGRCLICGYREQPLHIDHDHATGEVRGLLCATCNRAIGFAQNDVGILRRMVLYLRDPSLLFHTLPGPRS